VIAPRRFAWLSIAAASLTIALKLGAWAMTRSVGLLSDALESIVNLVAAIVALIALTVAAQPADEEHEYGHTKAEYFSGATEGVLIIVAAVGIMVTAIERLIHPQPLERLGIGMGISVLASLINAGVALVLRRASKQYNSIALEADAHHLLTDVFTTAGVLVGMLLVMMSGWTLLDPLIAIAVAIWIARTGIGIVRQSMAGLLDSSIPREQRTRVEAILDGFRDAGVRWHALRTRQAGVRTFVSVHLLVPGAWTVKRGHDLAEKVESKIRGVFTRATVLTHLEPVEDDVSYRDQGLDRHTTPES
jgi:cation diffusion facilitator family transporter